MATPDKGPDHIISFDENGRRYRCQLYALDQAPPKGLGKLEEFFKIWKDACNDGKLPRTIDMSFENLAGWHASVRTVEYGKDLYGPKKIKIMGEKYASYWGKEAMYDKILSDNPPPKEIIDKYYEYLKYFCDNHYCVSEGVVSDEYGFQERITWIDLPLSEDGVNITHAIGALLPVEQNI